MPTRPTSSSQSTDIWDVMHTSRAIRRFTRQSVDDSVLARCIEAATWAPSGGNQQPWRFIVLKSPETRAALQIGATRTLEFIAKAYRLPEPGAVAEGTPRARMARAVFDLHEKAVEVPAAVLFCSRPLPNMTELHLGSNIYPAMQNFLLAARASGLGTLVTGWHAAGEAEIREAVGVPADWDIAALVVAGWPAGNFGPVRRRPVADVTSLDTWEQTWPTDQAPS
ncbi:MAG: nox 2 [Pseudonocardiales bacterium]|nr:nox 2 [Pseudonocardiales bacterium]